MLFPRMFLAAGLAACISFSVAEPGEWTWVSGDPDSKSAVKGSLFASDPQYTPGTVAFGSTWRDSQDNLWLYSGASSYGTTANMWRYDTTANMWAWMHGPAGLTNPVYGTKGEADAANTPGRRSKTVTWVGADGHLYLYGGYDGMMSYSDVWMYDTSTNLWSWVAGSNQVNAPAVYGTMGTADADNLPGARASAGNWIDGTGNLWVFGGIKPVGGAPTRYNDLWKFDVGTKQWTWVKGDNSLLTGVFGELGTPAEDNIPPALESPACWTGTDGSLWMFGGLAEEHSNALWRYNPADSRWTWMAGSSSGDAPGVYGTRGIADVGNTPGARRSAAGVQKSADGSVWLYGGFGMGEAGDLLGALSDMWKWSETDEQWTWVAGDKETNASPVYGEVGVADAANSPGGRTGAQAWLSSDDEFYLFGNAAPQPAIGAGEMWRFELPSGVSAGASDWQLFR